MKILAVSVVYKPDEELLLRSIASYADAVDAIWIWRNSPLPAALEDALGQFEGLSLQGNGENAGIAKALNAAARYARENGFDAILAMDQDSVWHNLPDFLAAIEMPDAPEGIYAPLIESSPADGEGKPTELFSPLETAFTSGMLVPIPVIGRVGGWCEDFLVDAIDNEFCLHALSLGIRCWRVGEGRLEHRLGKVETKRLFGLRFKTYNYSPERLYGIYRNNLVAIKKYPSVSGKFRRQFWAVWFWKRPLRMLLGEHDLKAKFSAIFRGVRDARKA